jgi:hypothetical protein
MVFSKKSTKLLPIQHRMNMCRKNRIPLYLSVILFFVLGSPLAAQTSTELRRYKAPDARQAIAVDKEYFYAINNTRIVKRRKDTGETVKTWEDERLYHMNAGMIRKGKLYCAHSNYPQIPMHSSIEIFDTKTMEHVGSHSFGIEYGSCTWVLFRDNAYYVMFVHYDGDKNRQKNRDVSWSQLVKFDKNWRRVNGWVLPEKLVQRVSPYSISGGAFTNEGKLVCTHHHFEELYILDFPQMGSELVWEHTIPSPIRGQGIAFDPHEKDILWGIDKSSREVIKTQLLIE